jgi:chromosome segregation ATPase
MNQCNDPAHGAINAERAESRGLRKAWVELDDKRQSLERELTAVTEQRDRLAKACDQYSEDEILCKLQEITKQRDRLADQIEANHKGTLMLERMVYQLREQRDGLAEALVGIKNELGVPQPEYPAPVANAVYIATEALQSLNPNEL